MLTCKHFYACCTKELNISLRFTSNSEANASELLVNLEDKYVIVTDGLRTNDCR